MFGEVTDVTLWYYAVAVLCPLVRYLLVAGGEDSRYHADRP